MDTEALRAVHATLEAAYQELVKLRSKIDVVSADTAMAIGEATGLVAKAKALVGRDIDQRCN